MNPENLAALGALLGALGALIPHITAWFKNRSDQTVERRKMELASQEIDFISKWISATSELSGDDIESKRAHAEQRLIQLLDTNENQSVAGKTEPAEKPAPSLFKNILFYAYLGFYLLMALGSSLDEENYEPSLSTLFSSENLVMLGIFSVPLILLYFYRSRSKTNKHK